MYRKNVGHAHSFISARTHVTTLGSLLGAIVLELETRKPRRRKETGDRRQETGDGRLRRTRRI